MSYQKPEEIVRHLEQANQYKNDMWRMWRYTEKNGVLVLCGYRGEFEVNSFLSFRGTTFVRLYQWLQKASFHLGDNLSENELHTLSADVLANLQHVITIKVEDKSYYIGCRSVSFLILPKGASV